MTTSRSSRCDGGGGGRSDGERRRVGAKVKKVMLAAHHCHHLLEPWASDMTRGERRPTQLPV